MKDTFEYYIKRIDFASILLPRAHKYKPRRRHFFSVRSKDKVYNCNQHGWHRILTCGRASSPTAHQKGTRSPQQLHDYWFANNNVVELLLCRISGANYAPLILAPANFQRRLLELNVQQPRRRSWMSSTSSSRIRPEQHVHLT